MFLDGISPGFGLLSSSKYHLALNSSLFMFEMIPSDFPVIFLFNVSSVGKAKQDVMADLVVHTLTHSQVCLF